MHKKQKALITIRLFLLIFTIAIALAVPMLWIYKKTSEKKGEVLIQTHQPEHSLFTTLMTEGYGAFAQKALTERIQANLPPSSYHILIRAEASDPQDVLNFLQSLKSGLELNLQKWNSFLDDALHVEFWGPVAAPMLRRQGRYRFQLLLQSTRRKGLHQLLAEMMPYIYKSPLSRKVRWNIDVDPQEML